MLFLLTAHQEVSLLQFEKCCTKLRNSSIKIGGSGGAQICKKSRQPGLHVFFEEALLLSEAGSVRNHNRKHFKNRAYMVLGFVGFRVAFETERTQIIAQIAKWLFHKESGQIPGPVRHHLTLADTDKEAVILVF